MHVQRLHIFPDSERVEAALLEASRRGGAVDARTACSFAQLVDRCEPARWVGRAPASPFVVQSVLTRVAPTLAHEAFGDFASAPDFARSASEVISHLKSQNATVQLIRDAAGRADGTVRSRGLAIASLCESVEITLKANGLLDEADVLAVATQRLLTQGLPPRLTGFAEIEVALMHDLFPARLSFLDALAKACRQQGVRFVLTWPGVGRDEVDVFVAHAIRHIEHRWELDPHDVQLYRAQTPLEWVAEHVFAETPHRRRAPELTAFSAACARDEAREMARRIKRLVQSGTAPEQIAVVFRDVAADTELVLEAFEDLEIPLRTGCGVPLTASTIGRLALSLLSLADDDFEVAEVTAWLSSRYARAPVACEAPVAKWLAQAGIRDNVIGRSKTEGAYAVRLEGLERRLMTQLETTPALGVSLEASLREVRAVAQSVRALIALVTAIPTRGSFQHLLDAWWQAVDRVGVLSAPERSGPVGASPFLQREIDRALARDQATVEALGELHRSLCEALHQSELGEVQVERRVFARWLAAMAAQVNLLTPGVRTGAVWLLDAREVAGRHFEHVFCGGLVDGRFPGRAAPMPLLGEDQRKRLNVLAKQPLFRLGAAEGDFVLPLRLAEDRLLFHHVLSAATHHVTLCRPRFDASGRGALASPFLDALQRAVEGFTVSEVPLAVVPPLDELVTEADFRVRVALEVAGPAQTRQTPRDARCEALAAALGAEPWLVAAAAHGAAETERLRYFSSAEVLPGAFSGLVKADDVLAAVGRGLRYDAAHPVSANELKEWANCGFQGLSRRVLHLRQAQVQGEDLDQLGRGTFLHEALRKLIPVLRAAGFLGREVAAEQLGPLLNQAVASASEVIARERGTGHPQLWAIAKARVMSVVQQYVGSAALLPLEGAEPVLVETVFGKEGAPEGLREVVISAVSEGETDVYVTGAIDRLDVGAQVAGVVDYKSTRAQSARERAKALFNPDFQLPLYALAVHHAYPGLAVDGAWVGLQKRESTTLREITEVVKVTVEDLLSMKLEVRAAMREAKRPNLANAVHELLARRRSGDFGARPIDCRYCELQPVCRISVRRLGDEPGPGEAS